MPLISASGGTVIDPNVVIKIEAFDVQLNDEVTVFRDGLIIDNAIPDVPNSSYNLVDLLPAEGTFTYTARCSRNGVLGPTSAPFSIVYTLPSIPSLAEGYTLEGTWSRLFATPEEVAPYWHDVSIGLLPAPGGAGNLGAYIVTVTYHPPEDPMPGYGITQYGWLERTTNSVSGFGNGNEKIKFAQLADQTDLM
jgi:hypothetical protein